MEIRRYLRRHFHVEGPLAPGRFEAEVARRIGNPARRRPLLKAWRGYLAGEPGSVEAFYGELLRHPQEHLESLVYAIHLPFLEFYAEAIPKRLTQGRILEVGPFTGGLVSWLQEELPDREWHALEGVREVYERGAQLFSQIQWHLGWFGEEPLDLPPVDGALLLSVLPEGYLSPHLPPSLDEEAFDRQFQLSRRLRSLEGLLRPHGQLIYAHGPFLGKNLKAVERLLQSLGFDELEIVGGGEFALVLGRMPEALAEAAPAAQISTAPSPTEAPPPLLLREVAGLLEEGAYAEILLRVPEGASGEFAFLRGQALVALSRFSEAEATLARAGREEAEDLRVLCWVELGDYRRALPRLERLAARGGRYRLYLGRAYLGLGRLGGALRELWDSGLPERELYVKEALAAMEERLRRLAAQGDWNEVSRRVEFVEDLSQELLTPTLLRIGLEAALRQGLWSRGKRYAQRLYDRGEGQGALGLALVQLRVRGAQDLEGSSLAELKEVEPYLTDAVARAELPLAHFALGLLRYREGRFEEALRCFQRAAREGEGELLGLTYHFLALTRRALGHPLLEVLGDHKRAHAHRPYAVDELVRLSQEALEGGEPVLAREFLGRIRDRGFGASTDLSAILRLLEVLEGPWEAFQVLFEALQQTAQPSLDELALAYRLSRGFWQSQEAERVRGEYLAALYAAGQLDEAEALLKSELELHPEALEPRFDLAEHYERLGAYSKAIEEWKKALEVAYYYEKDLELAREILRNLFFLNPTDEGLELYLEELKATARNLAALEGREDPWASLGRDELLRGDLPRFHGEFLVVVGGHTQLRSRLLPFLEAQNLKVDWFDSDSYAAGREVLRRIQSRLERAHGLMIVSSYVGHDLSEPARVEAGIRGVPVYLIPGRARGATGFLRALREFAPQIFKKALSGSGPEA